jgi:large subunit ribosomal protein L5
MASRLKTKYLQEIVPALGKQIGTTNPHAIPKITKIVVSMGVGKAVADPKILEEVSEHLTQITGQKSAITRSRKSISQFKLREGLAIGCRVTLRGERMYEFLDRLISLAFPRVRDFRGINGKAFDGRGNYSVGLNDQTVFPEIQADKIKTAQGMNIAICTSAGSDERGKALLEAFGMPFRKDVVPAAK